MMMVVVECIYIQKRPGSWKRGPGSLSLRVGGRRRRRRRHRWWRWRSRRRRKAGGWSQSM